MNNYLIHANIFFGKHYRFVLIFGICNTYKPMFSERIGVEKYLRLWPFVFKWKDHGKGYGL